MTCFSFDIRSHRHARRFRVAYTPRGSPVDTTWRGPWRRYFHQAIRDRENFRRKWGK